MGKLLLYPLAALGAASLLYLSLLRPTQEDDRECSLPGLRGEAVLASSDWTICHHKVTRQDPFGEERETHLYWTIP
jgi:hypothetical protein